MKKLPEQVIRLAIVSFLFFGTLITVRLFVVPAYLAASGVDGVGAEAQEKAREVRFAGAPACGECHPDLYDIVAEGNHRTVSCEVCHGANQKHVDDPESVQPGAPRGRDFCPVCHAYNQSRPLGFPQINPSTHNPMVPCIECHSPHDPVPPEAVHGCDACHGKISRTKAVSPHAQIECTVCHPGPDSHAENPRVVKPEIPRDRAVCGACHGEDSDNRFAPKVSMETHGKKYVCWQCHYPHMPEVN